MQIDLDTERRERNAKRAAELGDRTFTLCDETFTYKAVVSYTVLEQLAGSNALEGVEYLRALEQSALGFLEEGQEERFLATVRNTKDPLTVEDLNALLARLTEESVNRPTLAPLPSTPGAPPTEITSKEGSSTGPATASAA